MGLRKRRQTAEVVIYNFNVEKQEISLVFRGTEIPSELREYPQLWRLTDKSRRIETIIISI
ncbi:MAG TPA: hypothetical protein P5154_05980 [Candidatus Izemoplasmatales bacterium]|nr:hypothetical protein [Bacillota bacterium]HRY78292.1 hypothetical protein [Candidatus Izemoplasmatales bacterium]